MHSSGGSYSIYYALAVASKELNIDHRCVQLGSWAMNGVRELKTARPDFTNTEPAARIGPFPQWGSRDKIVAMDPYGHLAPWIFKDTIEKEDGAVGSMSEPLRGRRVCDLIQLCSR